MTPQHITGVPYAHIVTLPTFSPATVGLILLASRQYKWTTNIPPTAIPAHIPDAQKTSL